MPSQPLRVLLVEDNPGDVRLIHWMLQPAEDPFELTCVDSLSAALDRLHGESFSVVLLDLSLPDSKGLETFRSVSASFPGLPIVVLSGLADETTAIRAVEERRAGLSRQGPGAGSPPDPLAALRGGPASTAATSGAPAGQQCRRPASRSPGAAASVSAAATGLPQHRPAWRVLPGHGRGRRLLRLPALDRWPVSAWSSATWPATVWDRRC